MIYFMLYLFSRVETLTGYTCCRAEYRCNTTASLQNDPTEALGFVLKSLLQNYKMDNSKSRFLCKINITENDPEFKI